MGKPVVKTTPVKTTATAANASETVTINLRVVENVMQYDKKLLTVKAGQKVVINLMNPDNMQHNLVIVQKGMMQKVGAAADAIARDPNGAEKSYVPQIPEVLHATKLVNSGEEVTLQFTAPTQPGDYPFVCTFPGHWRIMNGVLKVVN
jgi:azurin